MVVKWQTITVDEIRSPDSRSIAMGPFGSNIRKENYRSVGVPVIRGINLNAERFIDDGFVFLSEEKADELRGSNAFPGDIIFTAQGSIGQVGIIPKNSKYTRYVLSQNLMKVTCNKNRVDPLYVFYYFRSAQGQHEILSRANPTGVPCISQPLMSLRSFKVMLPPLLEQKAIASILGALDDKIELNIKMNETLEAMARAIYKSWFVDFDPIPGLGPHKEWQDTPLGEIPKGWRVGTLGEICENRRIGVKPEDAIPGTPYIGLEHMPRKCIALSEWGIADNVVSSKFLFRKGDVLFGKLRPYFHKVGVTAIDGVCSTDILVINAINATWYGLALFHISSDNFVSYVDGTSSGTKMPRTNWADMARYHIAIPPKTIAQKFSTIILSLIQTIQFNIHQSLTLASIRDALVPKLLSGEIRVMETTEVIKGAV